MRENMTDAERQTIETTRLAREIRDRAEAEFRLSLHRAHKAGWATREIAEVIGMHYTSVARICREVAREERS